MEMGETHVVGEMGLWVKLSVNKWAGNVVHTHWEE